MFMFQSIFAWSAYPMELIADLFVWVQGLLHHYLPAGPLTSLLVDGVIAGLKRRNGIYPADSYPVRLYIHTGRYRLHVARYVYDG